MLCTKIRCADQQYCVELFAECLADATRGDINLLVLGPDDEAFKEAAYSVVQCSTLLGDLQKQRGHDKQKSGGAEQPWPGQQQPMMQVGAAYALFHRPMVDEFEEKLAEKEEQAAHKREQKGRENSVMSATSISRLFCRIPPESLELVICVGPYAGRLKYQLTCR